MMMNLKRLTQRRKKILSGSTPFSLSNGIDGIEPEKQKEDQSKEQRLGQVFEDLLQLLCQE
ncbi:hypothetical protein GOP47_0006634 [Adiantum capillus-veneris]|uniref:Uncharacterized protein n=1 Tax=Adiantum capillus-veneris TaxID=13818 RepID=A0A9D4V487_ADICA|nr:hypothetical protein GOP47_0006634 [Adiantum capillus-veneris]